MSAALQCIRLVLVIIHIVYESRNRSTLVMRTKLNIFQTSANLRVSHIFLDNIDQRKQQRQRTNRLLIKVSLSQGIKQYLRVHRRFLCNVTVFNYPFKLVQSFKHSFSLYLLIVCTVTGNPNCRHTQYATLGVEGQISCVINETYTSIQWYFNNGREPVAYREDNVTKGRGYASGKYDVLPTGQLIIRNVTFDEEGVYQLRIYNDDFEVRTISLLVIGKS